METNNIYKFGPFCADLEEKKLLRHGVLVPLTPKVFQTLEVLLLNRDRVLSKNDLLDAVWPNRFVEEGNVTQNISVLRKAFGESDSATKYIATFPRVGYRFVAEVQLLDDTVTDPGEVEIVQPPGISFRFPEADSTPPPKTPHQVTTGRALSPARAMLLIALGLMLSPQQNRHELVIGDGHIVTHLPGREYQPAISPDGNSVAFTSHANLSGALRIAVAPTNASTPAEVVSDPGADAFSPAWSPDGKELAFLQERGARTEIMIRSGSGQERAIADVFRDRYGIVSRQLDWSPDGRFLAVSNKNASSEPFRIELIHLADGRRTPLTVPPMLSDGDFEPRFSPDGQYLAFVRVRSGASMSVAVVRMPYGDRLETITDGPPIGGLDWRPNSGKVLYTAEADGALHVREIGVGGDSGMRETILRAGSLPQISVSRQTGAIALASSAGDQNVWRAQVNSGQDSLQWSRWIASASDDLFPAYSPDGQRAVFLSDRSGKPQLWIRDERSGVEQEITTGDLAPAAASWTRSGDTIVFSSRTRRQLHRLSVATRQLQPIMLSGPAGSHSCVSPDGSSVFLAKRFYIYQASATGGIVQALTDQGGYPLKMPQSGKWIYYTRDRFSNEIWRLKLSDKTTERMIRDLQPGCWGCWTVNDDAIFYIRAGDGNAKARVVKMELSTGRVKVLGTLPGRIPPLGKGSLAVSADGSSLLAVVTEPGDGNITIALQHQ